MKNWIALPAVLLVLAGLLMTACPTVLEDDPGDKIQPGEDEIAVNYYEPNTHGSGTIEGAELDRLKNAEAGSVLRLYFKFDLSGVDSGRGSSIGRLGPEGAGVEIRVPDTAEEKKDSEFTVDIPVSQALAASENNSLGIYIWGSGKLTRVELRKSPGQSQGQEVIVTFWDGGNPNGSGYVSKTELDKLAGLGTDAVLRFYFKYNLAANDVNGDKNIGKIGEDDATLWNVYVPQDTATGNNVEFHIDFKVSAALAARNTNGDLIVSFWGEGGLQKIELR